jgi:hypothetical protein
LFILNILFYRSIVLSPIVLFHTLLEHTYQSSDDESADKSIYKSSQKSHECSRKICIISDIKRLHEADENPAVPSQISSDCKDK